jgi:uncharacterized FAD-dependent dehydrogenase
MVHELEIKLSPSDAANEQQLRAKVLQQLGLPPNSTASVAILRRSIDARSKLPMVLLRVAVYEGENPTPEPAILADFKPLPDNAPRVLIVGAGPAGYFAALDLIAQDIKPIVLDRGKDVQRRRRDLRAIQQFGIVHPHSNYCFGEGGAGTYSDGKLYTRSHKRGSIARVLQLFVEHGASSDILIDAHPHIGSNKLPEIVQNIRQTILHFGGDVLFDHHVTDFIIHKNKIQGVVANTSIELFGDAVLLATGHSARDIFQLLHSQKLRLEAKAFALGVRVEHPQPLIDNIQYHQSPRDKHLPAASYKLVCQTQGRGVFSFCMCPGGLVVPAATAPGEIVVNGMSLSRRDSPFANSGIVTSVETTDFKDFEHEGIFAGMAFQQSIEQGMFQSGDGSQKAPAQRLTDFIKGKTSSTLPESSYIPGLFSAPLHELLPKEIETRLRQGLQQFGKQMRGFYTETANVIATESRTSSPIRIPRNEQMMHPDCLGLFPCGEGAGYAGGILSAAMDGQNVARAISAWLGGIK